MLKANYNVIIPLARYVQKLDNETLGLEYYFKPLELIMIPNRRLFRLWYYEEDAVT